MRVPFTKAHGAKNDFLLTWGHDAPSGGGEIDRAVIARAICDRHTGIGADGWMVVTPEVDGEADGAIQLYNSDGSAPEISGNGTRCAAAFLMRHWDALGRSHGSGAIRIRTGAGVKTLRLLSRSERNFEFEMNMGRPEITAARFELPLATGPLDVTLVKVGNPQCVVPVTGFDFDWRSMGAEIESHAHFPERTNVSFIQPVSEHEIEVRFYERGAGETMSSGTGSTGAAVAAVVRGWVMSPVRVSTPAGAMQLRWRENQQERDDVFLTGPAEITGEGEFFL